MKKILLAFLLFLTYAASGQTIVDRSSSPSIIARDQRLFVERSLKVPVYADTTSANADIGKDSLGLIIQIRSTGVQYKRDTTAGGHKWSIIGGAGGDVSSVFSRTGAVVATEADYSAYYPLLSGSYDNPSWLNSLPASKISAAGNVTAASSKITLGGTPSGAGLQNFSIDVNQANLSLSSIGGLLNVNQINATGTPSGYTVLYGDGSWGAAGGGGGGGFNSNVGTGYRLAIPGTNNIKTLFGRGYVVIDSSTNTNGLTIYPDTAANKLATKTDITAMVTLTGTQTLTNKTISASSNTISNLTNTNLSGSAGITNANLNTMANNTIKGYVAGGVGVPSDLTGTQVTGILDKASSSAFGVAKVDGTTITAVGGVISAVGGGGADSALISASKAIKKTVSGTTIILKGDGIRYYPEDYGSCAADSSTDCTAAIRAAIAAMGPYNGILQFSQGNYIISDSIDIPKMITVQGAGGNIATNDELGLDGTGGPIKSAVTNIIMKGNNKTAFVVDAADTNSRSIYNTGFTMRDLAIKYQGTTPTRNAGIRIVDGGSYQMMGVSISGFWINIDQESAAYASIHGVTFANSAYVGLRIRNSAKPDNGGTMISNCNFLSGGYTHPYAGLLWNNSGAFRMENCEFNITTTDTSKTPMYCIVMDNSATKQTQELYLNNISLSGFDSCALKADNLHATSSPTTRGMIFSNMIAYGTFGDSLNQAAFQIGTKSAVGSISNVMVSNLSAIGALSAKAGLSVPVCKFTKIDELHVSGISKGAYYTLPSQYIGCTNAYEAVENDGASAGMTDANGNPSYLRLKSPGEVDIIANSAYTPGGGPASIFFKNGVLQSGFINGNQQWKIGAGPFSTVLATFPQLMVEKDTAARAGITIYNNSNTAAAQASLAIQGAGSNFAIWTNTSSNAGYKNIGPSTVGVYAGGSMGILADGGSLSLGNITGNILYIPSSNTLLGINSGTSPKAELDLGQNLLAPNNGPSGILLSVRGGLNISDNTTATSGTVADVAVNGFGVNTLAAANTGVTYTDASTLEIVGKPTAGTNVTMTNAYALKILAGDQLNKNGNLIFGTAGNGLLIKEGTNATMGSATLAAGTVTVSTTKVTANSRIILTVQSLGTVTAAKPIAVTARTAGTSFTITSADNTDTSIIGWIIFEPAP